MKKQRKSPKKKSGLLRPVLLALATAAAIVVGAELIVRPVCTYSTNTMFRPHPSLFWELTPGLRSFTHEAPHFKEIVSTNSLGLRGGEVPGKAPGELRILCLGDSSTFGHGVNDKETYPARLEEMLRKTCPDRTVTVVNGGVQGYTSFQGLRLLKEKGPALRPDIVTLAFINNDVSLDVMPDSRRAPGGAAGAIRDLLFKSRLYMLLRNVSVDLEAEHLAEKTCTVARVSVDEFRDNIRQFVDLSRSMGFRLVLINMPHDRATTTHDDYRRVLRETASAEKIPLVDCFASWKKARRDAMYLDMVHPSTEGQKAIAAEILKVIKDQKVISTP